MRSLLVAAFTLIFVGAAQSGELYELKNRVDALEFDASMRDARDAMRDREAAKVQARADMDAVLERAREQPLPPAKSLPPINFPLASDWNR